MITTIEQANDYLKAQQATIAHAATTPGHRWHVYALQIVTRRALYQQAVRSQTAVQFRRDNLIAAAKDWQMCMDIESAGA